MARQRRRGLTWQPRNAIVNTLEKTITQTHMHTKVNIEKQVQAPTIQLESPVNALDVSGDVWVAATSYGIVTSHDQGASWQGGPVMGEGDYLSVTVKGDTMVAARADSVVISKDAGKSWWPMGLPTMLTRIHRVVFSPDGTLWLGAREGVYLSRDLGKTWMWIHRLPFRDVDDLSYDAESKRILVSSRTSDQVYAVDPKTMAWDWWQTGYDIALIRAAGDRLVAASLDDGVLVGPELMRRRIRLPRVRARSRKREIALNAGARSFRQLCGRFVFASGSYQNFRWNPQMLVQPPNHWQGQRTISAQHLVDAGAASNHADKRLHIFPLLFQAKSDCLEGIGYVDGEARALVGFDECHQNLKTVACRRSFIRTPEALDLTKRLGVVLFVPDRPNFHISPSLHQLCHKRRASRAT